MLSLIDDGAIGGRWDAYASGLCNPVGFGWHPHTGVMYASNNSPDHLGFDVPPEYFSRLAPGSFHGMPWFQFDGQGLGRDPCIRSQPPSGRETVQLPVATFPARSAPPELIFIPDGALEPVTRSSRSTARGRRRHSVDRQAIEIDAAPHDSPIVRFQDGVATCVDNLVTGFQLPDGSRWARPAGVAIGPDGVLYIMSDARTEGLLDFAQGSLEACATEGWARRDGR